jgi:hypothetical protein
VKLFFNYSIDCETPLNTPYTGGSEREPFFGGPASWDDAERSVRGFVEQMDSLRVREGASLFVYPDVAREQRRLFREMSDAGVEIALHLNGLRYSRLTGARARWLGAMSRDEQHEALRMAKADLEDSISRPCLGYRACYGSANDDTFAICDELGFQWTSNPSGRCRTEVYADWTGSCPFPHHANRGSRLIPGDLDLYEIPVTRGLATFYGGDATQPLDLRVETPTRIIGEDRQLLRRVIQENVMEMQKQDVPVRVIIGASHNTNPFGNLSTYQAQTLAWVIAHARHAATEHGLRLSAASFASILHETRGR